MGTLTLTITVPDITRAAAVAWLTDIRASVNKPANAEITGRFQEGL